MPDIFRLPPFTRTVSFSDHSGQRISNASGAGLDAVIVRRVVLVYGNFVSCRTSIPFSGQDKVEGMNKFTNNVLSL